MVDYDLSVKALVNTLVHRSSFFQSLQGDYILNCTDDLRSNSVRTVLSTIYFSKLNLFFVNLKFRMWPSQI